MNWQVILYWVVIALGVVSILLNVWVFSLTGNIQSILFGGIGVFVAGFGIYQLRRLNQGKNKR